MQGNMLHKVHNNLRAKIYCEYQTPLIISPFYVKKDVRESFFD